MLRVLILIIAASSLSACVRAPELNAARLENTGQKLTTSSASRRNDPPVILDIKQAQRALSAYRQKHKLDALEPHPLLMKSARLHARDLARHNKVSHTGSDGSDPAQRATQAGYIWSSIGENVSAGRNSVPEVIRAWHDSPSHRRNLQHPAAIHFGMAVVHNPKSTLSNYWVLVVGAPKKKSNFNLRIGG